MDIPFEPSEIDPDIKEIRDINCIETSPLKDIAYVAGRLTSDKARQSCPVLVIDLVKNYIKCRVYEFLVIPRHPRNEEHTLDYWLKESELLWIHLLGRGRGSYDSGPFHCSQRESENIQNK